MPATTGALSRSRQVAIARSAAARRKGAASAGCIRSLLPARAHGRQGGRLRAAGTDAGARPSREPLLAPAVGTAPLSWLSHSLRRQPALLGAPSGSGTGLPAVDVAGLEDAGARCLDWME